MRPRIEGLSLSLLPLQVFLKKCEITEPKRMRGWSQIEMSISVLVGYKRLRHWRIRAREAFRMIVIEIM